MASPSASPAQFARLPSIEDDNDIDNSSLLLFQWVHSLKPLYKALSIVILSSAFAALVFSSLPLWRPFGVLMLHKLWDILRFLVLATGIGLGIINSNLWRDNCGDDDTGGSISSDGGKEDSSVSSKVPFGGMFYSGLQSSISFDDKELDMGGYGVTRTESGDEGVGGENSRTPSMATTSRASSMAKATANDENENNSENTTKLVKETFPSVPSTTMSNMPIGKDTERNDDNRCGDDEPLVSLPSVHNNKKVASAGGHARLIQASDDLSLGTKLGNEHRPKHPSKGHRRGSSLEFTIQQEGTVRKPRDIHPVMDRHQKDAAGERFSLSSKAPSAALKASEHAKRQSNASKNSQVNVNSASTSTNTSRHSRSRSAYDLNDLLVHENGPRSKPSVTSQLRRRRNVSLSSDLDKEFARGGVSAWLEGLPSPPVPPPLMNGFNIGVTGGVDLSSEQDESSLRKAYTESLAPWRVPTVAMPVDIPHKEGADKSKEKLTPKEEKQAPSKETTGVILSRASSPSTPKSFMGSPSPAELNKKVDAYIARFHERMRLQRLESLERARQTLRGR